MFDIEEYNYELPPQLIAQVPAARRDYARLLVVDRQQRSFADRHFFELPELLKTGDLLVVNDTRVVAAKLFGQKESGGRVEILVLEFPAANSDDAGRTCLLKAAKAPREGAVIHLDGGVAGRVKKVLGNGRVRMTFSGPRPIDELLEEAGHMPLPPYIKRRRNSAYAGLDRERYQTIFADKRAAVAAPTAGLHFTEDLIEKLNAAGIGVASITLHVGYGTFKPVRSNDIRQHTLGQEAYHIAPQTAAEIKKTRENGGRVVAVGTTVVRTLETAAGSEGHVKPGSGWSNLLITPGFSFKAIDAMITNFHLPKSSLLFLVAAFAGLNFIKEAYYRAVERKFRFYSYGDAMLIL
jgi:S-adenosylmethionine:tRNA ribosyltransferase-isomerase